MTQKYVYKPYNTLFPELFFKEKARLLSALGSVCLDIEHIGSTAIPSLGGKGIIDIGLSVAKEDIKVAYRKIENLGYLFRESGSNSERWFFRIDLPDPLEGTRRYHLHLTFPESIEWKKLLVFRDYLKSDPVALQEYIELKRKSAEEAKEDGVLYREKKSPFIERVLAMVLKTKFIL